MAESHNPRSSATDTMRKYETNRDTGDSASSNDPVPAAPGGTPTPGTGPGSPTADPVPDRVPGEKIPMSERQSPWEPERGSESDDLTGNESEVKQRIERTETADTEEDQKQLQEQLKQSQDQPSNTTTDSGDTQKGGTRADNQEVRNV